MSGISPGQLQICWLYNPGTFDLESAERELVNARVNAFPLSGLLRDYGRSEVFQEVVDASRDADAVVIDWDIRSAPIISILRLQSTPRSVPFIAVDTADTRDARIMARLMWADDVVVPPVTDRLIRASIQSHQRSVVHLSNSSIESEACDSPAAIEIGPIRLNIRAHRVLIRKEEVSVTPLHFKLLRYFLEHHDELVTRTELMNNVWDIDYERNSNSVDVSIYHLRTVLKKHDLSGCIETVRGKGYRFVVP